MTTTAAHRTTSTPVLAHARDGALGGLAGGLVFGILMQLMGMIPMVAQLVGSTSPLVGWLVHLAISVGLGASSPSWSVTACPGAWLSSAPASSGVRSGGSSAPCWRCRWPWACPSPRSTAPPVVVALTRRH